MPVGVKTSASSAPEKSLPRHCSVMRLREGDCIRRRQEQQRPRALQVLHVRQPGEQASCLALISSSFAATNSRAPTDCPGRPVPACPCCATSKLQSPRQHDEPSSANGIASTKPAGSSPARFRALVLPRWMCPLACPACLGRHVWALRGCALDRM